MNKDLKLFSGHFSKRHRAYEILNKRERERERERITFQHIGVISTILLIDNQNYRPQSLLKQKAERQ
jgi:hypothetical protein